MVLSPVEKQVVGLQAQATPRLVGCLGRDGDVPGYRVFCLGFPGCDGGCHQVLRVA
jgi:hypothetical protein